MKKYLPYTIALILAFVFTLLTHLKLIPHSVRQPTYYSYKTTADFLYMMFFGWVIVSFGIYLTRKADAKKTQVICPKCEHSEEIFKSEIKEKKCPKCEGLMLPLKGFFEKK